MTITIDPDVIPLTEPDEEVEYDPEEHEYTFSKLPARLQDRAQRFTNIYHSLRNNQ